MISNVFRQVGQYLPEFIRKRLQPTYRALWRLENYAKYVLYSLTSDDIIDTEYGFQLSIDRGDAVQRRYITRESQGEEDLYNLFKSKVRNDQGAFIDVGANIGFYSFCFCTVSDGDVYAFEPLSNNVEKLRENTKLNSFEDRIRVLPFGLSNQTREVELEFFPFNRGAANDFSNRGELDFLLRSEDVQFKTLDEIEIQDRISTIKIDVEGHELEVLRGGNRLIRTQQPNLLIEIHPSLIGDRPYTVEDLVSYIFHLGYESIYLVEEQVSLNQQEAIDSVERIKNNYGIWVDGT